jgi:hypothetical protein
MIVVSRDGFVKWAWSSEAALKSGRFMRTSGAPVEIPAGSGVGLAKFTDEVRVGIDHPAGVWFAEPVRELSIRAEAYDLNYTLLHFGNEDRSAWFAEPHEEDTYDRLTNSRR